MASRPGLTHAEPGTRVRLTGRFLKSTGQQAGDEGSKVWTVRACKCGQPGSVPSEKRRRGLE